MNGFAVVGVAIWLVSMVVGIEVGRTKGRGFNGFALCFFLGPFGLVGLAAMPPSPEYNARRDKERADALARAISGQLTRGGAVGSEPVAPRHAASSDRSREGHSGETVAGLATPSGQALAGWPRPDNEPDEDTVSVSVTGCSGVGRGPGPLVVAVQPGWVFINACQESCDVADHELMLTPSLARDVVAKTSRVADRKRPATVAAGPSDEEVLISWSDDHEAPAGIIVDWTALYMAADAATDDELDESCGWIFLQGDLETSLCPLNAFLEVIAAAGDLAEKWENGNVSAPDVMSALSRFGATE